MNKTEFLSQLEQRLLVLNENEREDLISEYAQHIEMKISSGLTEEEAIADFGNFDDLIKELLDAYHLNTEYQTKGQSFSAQATWYLKSAAHFMTSLLDAFFHKTKKQLFQLFLQLCGLLIFLGSFWLIAEFSSSIIQNFLVYSLPFGNSIGRFFNGIFRFAIFLFMFCIDLYLLVFFLKKYVIIDYVPMTQPDTYRETVSASTGNKVNMTPNEAIEKIVEKTGSFSQRIVQDHEGATLGELCMNILLLCLKFFAFFFLVGAALTAFCLLVSAGVIFVFALMGYSIIGPFCIITGCTILAVICTMIIFQFIFGGMRHDKNVL